jgi:hypothetical protein
MKYWPRLWLKVKMLVPSRKKGRVSGTDCAYGETVTFRRLVGASEKSGR